MCTPTFLTFARELRTPRDVLDDFRCIVVGENAVSELTPYLLKLTNVMKDVREVHETQQDVRKWFADGKRKQVVSYQEGDLVFIKIHVLKGITSKFVPCRDGPYEIYRKRSDVSYEIAEKNGSCPIGSYHVFMAVCVKGYAGYTKPSSAHPKER